MTYDPWGDLRSRQHITFGVTKLPAGDGWWLPQVPAIVLGRHLTRVQRRCVLAHELVHADEADTQCADLGAGAARIARRRERHADHVAAERLISLDDLADALSWALSFAEVAEALDVTEHLAQTRICNLTDEEKSYIEQQVASDHRDVS